MIQQQGVSRPKAPRILEVANQNALEDSEETGTGESMEDIPKSSSGRSKFEQSKRDEEDPEPPLTIQFGSLPPVMASNYLLANEFKNKESEEEEEEGNEEEACVLECEGGQTSQEIHDG